MRAKESSFSAAADVQEKGACAAAAAAAAATATAAAAAQGGGPLQQSKWMSRSLQGPPRSSRLCEGELSGTRVEGLGFRV